MTGTSVFLRRIGLALALSLSAGTGLAATVANAPAAQMAATPMSIDVDEGQVIRLPRPAAQVFVANPEIADIQAPQRRTVLVLGKKPGRTTIIALDDQGEEITRIAILVVTGLGLVRDHLLHDYPQLAVTVEGTPTSVIVAGKVETPEQAQGVIELVKAYAPDPNKVIDRMSVTSEVQVQLRVHVAEISRQLVNDFGINWQSVFKSGSTLLTGPGSLIGLGTGRTPLINTTTNQITQDAAGDNVLAFGANNGASGFTAVLDLLGQEGLATILAEPTLTAISGQTATFLAGGEIPVVTASGIGSSSVTYKEYGVRLKFTPTVLAHDRISLAVRPEVSQLTSVGSVSVGGVVIPALSTRRVDTTVELGSGDSFVLGGLLQNDRNNNNNRLPGLGDIPVIGKLFQSQTFQNNESELVVIVTPYIVHPTKPTELAIAEHPFRADSDIEKLMMGATADGTAPQPDARLYGHAGFAY